MDDRELLKLAAKAAGYGVKFDDRLTAGIWTPESGVKRCYWNPLEEDGDALRLAVEIGITVAFWECPQNSVAAYVSGDGIPASSERHGEDKGAATRRAIVRAAAAIGWAM
tara:strand:- start:3509 stop:3838 length:330 start_codon:yes stop_codon:yes gene_type:complete